MIYDSAYNKIIFYNNFHNGDIHLSRNFVKKISEHFIKTHSEVSPDKMTQWFKNKSQSKIDKIISKNNQFKGYDKKLKKNKNKKWIKVIYTPMGNKR